MEVSAEVHKIIICIISTVFFFFNSGRDADDELVRFSLFQDIIKNANLMRISFRVKHPQTFGES